MKEQYLVTYEYQEILQNRMIATKITTKLFSINQLENIQEEVQSYQKHIKVLSFFKL